VAALLLAAAWGVDALTSATSVLRAPWRWAGLGPLAAGLGVAGAALFRFHAHGTTHNPFGLPTVLVTTGPYRLSRNPMYVGLLLGLLGVAMLRGTVPFLAVPLVLFLVLRTAFIPYEEARMERLFGDAYLAWKARTRRWL
jgi:protein-S-isoprenylcysteine O-methyltransferase Ste14